MDRGYNLNKLDKLALYGDSQDFKKTTLMRRRKIYE